MSAPLPLKSNTTPQSGCVEELSDKLFRRIAAIMQQDAGIALPDSKSSLVNSRVSKRLRALKLASFEEYCDLVESNNGHEERRFLISVLTTNVTRFFREPHHFEDLKTIGLPPLIAKARSGGRVRIWSAGCSSGEEASSIALTALSLAPEITKLNFRILATDIDPAILAKARRGQYSDEGAREIPEALRKKYFVAGDPGFVRVGPELQSLITFRELNLVKPWPVKGPFDVIFCRNTVIYFDDKTSQFVWQEFADRLGPDGRLYIGHSERVTGPAEARLEGVGVTTYRMRTAH